MGRDRGPRPRPGGGKLPAQQPETAGDHSTGHPKFCLRFPHRDFDVTSLPKDQRADLALTLQQRASMTWTALQQAGRHGQGYEQLPRAQFRGPIPAAFEDRDKFHVFRYSGRLPMAGVRSGDVLHIIWIEARFGDLYDHG